MSWDHQFGVLLPPERIDLGNRIAQALDSWGDGEVFHPQRVNSAGQAFTLSWAGEAFALFLAAARQDAELLHSAVAQAYLNRFADPPTLAECTAFLEAAEIYLDDELDAVRTLFRTPTPAGGRGG